MDIGKMHEKAYLGLEHPHGQHKSITHSTKESKYYCDKILKLLRDIRTNESL